MITPDTLYERIEGCLIGAVIGAELGWSRYVYPEPWQVSGAGQLATLRLEKVDEAVQGMSGSGVFASGPNRLWIKKATSLIALGARAYLEKQGRVTPEDFGALLAVDEETAAPAFTLDVLHTTQELLKEGMHPRISGMGTAPHGLMIPAMVSVGIYHYADPEYAYLDGVELASVAQPRLGADWSGLAAAAVASALNPASTPGSVAADVLALAHENNKDVFYELNRTTHQAERLRSAGPEDDLTWWRDNGGRYDAQRQINFMANNPLSFVLPLVNAFDQDAERLFKLLLWPEGGWLPMCHLINPILAGALVGALHGCQAFQSDWLTWAEPVARPWFAITQVIDRRAKRESLILKECQQLAAEQVGQNSRLEDKIYGCLLASSIGNAMGSTTESMSYLEIDARYPGGVQTILDPRRLESEDDNQMAMLLVETYLRRDGRPVMARHFGQTWYERLNRDHFFPLCMGAAYDMIRGGWDARITGHWSVVTGSTVMCMEPVGIYHLADPEFARIDATAISYMYQRGLDVAAAAILAAAVAEALRPDTNVESVCEAALNAAPRQPWKTFDRRAFSSVYAYIETCLGVGEKYTDVLAARRELYEKCLLYHPIDPIELLGLSLATFLVAKGDVRQSAIGGTNLGRDADTIAGRAAMLSGAVYGSAGVPPEWIALFSPASLERIRRNARQMTSLILDKKRKTLQIRQSVSGRLS